MAKLGINVGASIVNAFKSCTTNQRNTLTNEIGKKEDKQADELLIKN